MAYLHEPGYLFIDGGHLRQHYSKAIREWYGNDGEIDFIRLKLRYEAFKVFYYDCLDDLQREGENPKDYSERVTAQEMRFEAIGSVIGTHVRKGALVGVSKKKRRQTAVDILLAVDMMTHAIRQNMKRAVLLSGDDDFEPLVESMVQMGMYIAVSGDARHTSKDLITAADAFLPLRFLDYVSFSTDKLIAQEPQPTQNTIVYQNDFYEGDFYERGELDDGRKVIISLPHLYRAYVPAPDSHTAETFDYTNPDRLKLYIKILFGPVKWD